MLQAIVGIEIEVTRLVGKAKLSQDETAADRMGAIDGVRQRQTDAATALANAMLSPPPPLENTP
jgi:transcriptional regulator